MPSSFVFIFIFILLATVLTHVVPAGNYERTISESGQEIVLPESFQYVESTPVGPFRMFVCIGNAFVSTADIIFCILFAYCFIGILIECGVFNTIFGIIVTKLKDKSKFLLPIIMLSFGLMGSVAGLAEETFGMFPVCISLALALGYDKIVGGAIVYLAVFTGFAAATFNPFTIGIAQAIAEVPTYSGLGYRIICFIIFMSILIIYVMKYAAKVKKNPTKSLLYGYAETDVNIETSVIADIKLNISQILSMALFIAILILIVVGAIKWQWYISEITGLFLGGIILLAVINRWSPNKLAERIVSIGSDTLFSMMAIGFSNAICNVMTQGNITDTIVHAMASLLEGTSGYISALTMLIIQNLLNFFIPSGPGQAAVSMPIMSAFADVSGMTRQLAVLAFQFGDGFSNIFWPTMVCMMCGIMKIPVGKWYKFVTPLFGLLFLAQVILVMIAVFIGY